MNKEALKLALEALEEVKSWKSPTRWDGCFDKEITAIKEALSGCQCPECQVVLHTSDCAVHSEPAYPNGECNCGAQPEQEPVGWAEHGVINWLADKQFNHTSFLYDTPAQRTWVGLTEEEIYDMYNEPRSDAEMIAFARAIEAKLKEKNNG